MHDQLIINIFKTCASHTASTVGVVPAEQPTGWSLLVQQVHRGDTPQGIGGNSAWGQVRRDMYLCGVSGGLTPCTLTSTVVILSVECFVLGYVLASFAGSSLITRNTWE